ncbi:TIGR02646 family protein [Flavobacterium davisii]|uniref:TIGR02646 family protein n=1 Tax=Flavobacterium davisii TaxID=2906077 RepID=A0A246GM93_9FLAO|nr:retron system putative HNH endonuclease [Flavobacterium davisii]OWP84830.1 TIGR02646 family protein [Flavobacterium davisii]
MRYIQKGAIPVFMQDWINARTGAGQNLRYEEFNQKQQLNDVLRVEQKHICCYCQQRINQFKQNNNGNCHNEHLVPQKGVNGNTALQMAYTNIFASCSYSEGVKQKHQYCGTAKGDLLIHPFIQDVNCSSFFKYNAKGEIIPNSPVYNSYEEFLRNEPTLGINDKRALETIRTLNLNVSFLVEERKKLQTRLFKVLNVVPLARVQLKIQQFNNDQRFYPYIDMLLYYMNKKK